PLQGHGTLHVSLNPLLIYCKYLSNIHYAAIQGRLKEENPGYYVKNEVLIQNSRFKPGLCSMGAPGELQSGRQASRAPPKVFGGPWAG
ncbi:mCG144817, partial [Mus musculus]